MLQKIYDLNTINNTVGHKVWPLGHISALKRCWIDCNFGKDDRSMTYFLHGSYKCATAVIRITMITVTNWLYNQLWWYFSLLLKSKLTLLINVWLTLFWFTLAKNSIVLSIPRQHQVFKARGSKSNGCWFTAATPTPSFTHAKKIGFVQIPWELERSGPLDLPACCCPCNILFHMLLYVLHKCNSETSFQIHNLAEHAIIWAGLASRLTE